MGVINITPDSFSDGGKYHDPESAAARARELVAEGADILDIGAVSTRPGAPAISDSEEKRRLIPALEKILRSVSIPVSIDTTSPAIARKSLELGAHIINDVSGLKDSPEIAGLCAQTSAGLVLMHRRGNSKTMQDLANYSDVVGEVKAELAESVQIARRAGVAEESLIVDPGIGFAKTPAQNLEILRRLKEFKELGLPVMVGTSNKSFIGDVLKREISERKIGTIASCVLAVREGARILRVHDVRSAKDAAVMTLAVIKQEEK